MISQVKMLLQEEVDSILLLELIDDLQRLGISCHFHHEIAQIFNSSNETDERDLYSTALRFRLLRQHGFRVSQGAQTSLPPINLLTKSYQLP